MSILNKLFPDLIWNMEKVAVNFIRDLKIFDLNGLNLNPPNCIYSNVHRIKMCNILD